MPLAMKLTKDSKDRPAAGLDVKNIIVTGSNAPNLGSSVSFAICLEIEAKKNLPEYHHLADMIARNVSIRFRDKEEMLHRYWRFLQNFVEEYWQMSKDYNFSMEQAF